MKSTRLKKRALARSGGFVFASVVLLAVGFLSVMAVFNEGVASQIAASRNGTLNLAPPAATGPEAVHDEFRQQKLDAKQEELPAQF